MPSDGSTVLFRRAGTGLGRQQLREFAADLCERVASHRGFVCLLTDDRELQRLNRMFLAQDFPTDVLSFPSGADNPLGEIAISVERARQQAAEHGHSPDKEIRILMLHGVLHLLGMDHEQDGGRMARAEKRWRRALSLPDGLIERTRRKVNQ